MTKKSIKDSISKSLADSTREILISPTESPLPTDPATISSIDLKESYRRLVLLYEVGRQIYAETDMSQVFDTILSVIAKTINVERAFVAVVSGNDLVPKASYGVELSDHIETWPLSSTMLRRVLKQGVSLRTTDALQDDQFKEVRSVDLYNIRSVMCCPLGERRKPTGIIYVDNRMSAGVFSRADLEFLNALSHYAALAIKNAEERFCLSQKKELAEARLDALREEMAVDYNIVGMSKQMVEIYHKAQKASRKNVPVIIEGETGTGKEVLARFIHASSERSANPFIAVNVSALPKALVESELFGHEKGAFTGAERKRVGRCELAHGGTLFLDEVQDIPLEVQPKLLRFLEQHSFERLGSNEVLHADVRIVCASNKDLTKCVAEGSFREDLFYRLNSITLKLSPLRERKEDIVPLIHHFLRECGSEKIFDEEALDCLVNYLWPGNVRELRNTIEAIDVLAEGRLVRVTDLPERIKEPGTWQKKNERFKPLPELIAQIEKEHIVRAIDLANGNYEKAIRLLGISRSKFFSRKKEYAL